MTATFTRHLPLALGAVTGLVAALPAYGAEELARVVSTQPVMQQVSAPRQVCAQEQVTTQTSRGGTGAGAIMGALAGGALGNAVGDGSGRALATGIGLIAGAIVGDRVEGGNRTQPQTQLVERCTTQTFYENRIVAYNVVYEYGGKQYSVQMPTDPGPYVRLQITPVGGAAVVPAAPVAAPVSAAPAPVITPAPVVPAPVPQSLAPVQLAPAQVVATTVYYPPVVTPAVVYAAPVAYAAPVVYAAPRYVHPPVAVSLNLGYSRGWGHAHYRGPWR